MNKELEKIIGENIKALREKRNLTQEQMAAKFDVGQPHLYPDEIIRLKKILNVEYDEIFNV